MTVMVVPAAAFAAGFAAASAVGFIAPVAALFGAAGVLCVMAPAPAEVVA